VEYILLLRRHIGAALVDIGAISFISLMPLILARLAPFARAEEQVEPFWGFLTNGQLAFYSIGSLAVMLMTVFRGKLPTNFGIFIGLGSVVGLVFLAWLIGIDPKLERASITFVGVTTLYLYIVVQILRIIVDAAKQVGPGDALRAGDRASQGVKAGLAERKGVDVDE
jgi:hypothetical protein